MNGRNYRCVRRPDARHCLHVCRANAGVQILEYRRSDVDNWDVDKRIVMRFELASDGSIRSGSVFYDMTSVPGEIALDGLKVDRSGNVCLRAGRYLDLVA